VILIAFVVAFKCFRYLYVVLWEVCMNFMYIFLQ
jgi:hypothetical protein